MSVYYLDGEAWVGVVEKEVIGYTVTDSFIAVVQQSPGVVSGSKAYFFIPLQTPFISDIGYKNVAGPLSLDDVTGLAVERGARAPLAFKTL